MATGGPHDGITLGQKALKQVAQAVRDNERRVRSSGESVGGVSSGQRELCVILDADLDAAENSKTDSASCEATVCIWSSDQEYVETGRTITVWNHSETTNYDEDTFGTAKWLDGHWWFFGDCAAMSEREPAP